MIKRFFGWVFLTDAYLDTLSDEQIAVRAMGYRARSGYVFENKVRGIAGTIRRLMGAV